jgi:hypothetical protein
MRIVYLALFAFLTTPAMADGYTRVTDRGAFISLVGGKSLTSLGVSSAAVSAALGPGMMATSAAR